MAATPGVRAGPVPAVCLLRRRAIEKLTEAIDELWFCGVAPGIADRLEHEVVPKLDAGGVPRLAQAYDLVRWSREQLAMMCKREEVPETVFTLVRQGALLAREVIVVAHFTSLPAVVELNHNDFRRHMETAFRRWIDTELLSELSQSYSMVMMVGKRREEFEASTGPMSERPLPIRVDQHDDPKVIGQYRYVEKVNGRSKYMNELNDLGVFMQYDNHKWRMFCAANACYLVRGATGK